ncbi:MAG: helix-turn-helix domain-containing protein [Bacteroidia bacterium]|nr:helix-turn-helix domain-containing protein [Bacteroidia bacterium]MDW8335329.1 helix-turn-helix domain-containing protein [Bacteroidia bacterium]
MERAWEKFDPILLTVDDAAKLLGVSTSLINRLVYTGDLKARRLPGQGDKAKPVFLYADLMDFARNLPPHPKTKRADAKS